MTTRPFEIIFFRHLRRLEVALGEALVALRRQVEAGSAVMVRPEVAAVAALAGLAMAWLHLGSVFALFLIIVGAGHGLGRALSARAASNAATRALAGILAGLLSVAALLGVCAVIGARRAIDLIPLLAFAHVVSLLPLRPLPGAALAADIVDGLGRHGRALWLAFLASLSLIGIVALALMWQSWLALPFALLAALALLTRFDSEQADRRGPVGAVLSLVLYAGLALGHGAVAALAQSALRQNPVVVVADERIQTILLSDVPVIRWMRRQRRWLAQRPGGWAGWSDAAGDQPLRVSGGFTVATRRVVPMRIDLSDGRQCLTALGPETIELWRRPRLTLDAAALDRLECHVPREQE